MKRKKDRLFRRPMSTPAIETPTQRQVDNLLALAIDHAHAVLEANVANRRAVDVQGLVAYAFVSTFLPGTTTDQIIASLTSRRDLALRYAHTTTAAAAASQEAAPHVG